MKVVLIEYLNGKIINIQRASENIHTINQYCIFTGIECKIIHVFPPPKKTKVKVISETKYSWLFCLELYTLSKCYEEGGGREEAVIQEIVPY